MAKTKKILLLLLHFSRRKTIYVFDQSIKDDSFQGGKLCRRFSLAALNGYPQLIAMNIS